jgi:hypothetical protein
MRRQTEVHICQNDYLTIHFVGDIHFAQNWYGDAETIKEKLCAKSSRPHTLAPELYEESEQFREAYQNGYTDGQAKAAIENEKCIEGHRAEAARTATLAALSLLEEWDYHNNRNFLKPHPTFYDMIRLVRDQPEETRKHIEALRQEAQQ